jgi:hypothetical protein
MVDLSGDMRAECWLEIIKACFRIWSFKTAEFSKFECQFGVKCKARPRFDHGYHYYRFTIGHISQVYGDNGDRISCTFFRL